MISSPMVNFISFALSYCHTSGVASAIIKSSHWEKVMTWYDESERVTPMKLLIRHMPGTVYVITYVVWFKTICLKVNSALKIYKLKNGSRDQ